MERWRGMRIARPCSSTAALLYCAFSLCALITTSTTRIVNSISLDHSSPRTDHFYTDQAVAAGGRRLRSARLRSPAAGEEWRPGSYPPRCAAKCGECTPCIPVHLLVPPGAPPEITEYYPEAWRCKCGSRLYIP